jgi:hypothetical protein
MCDEAGIQDQMSSRDTPAFPAPNLNAYNWLEIKFS